MLIIFRADFDSSSNWVTDTALVSSQTNFLGSVVGFNVSLSEVCWESVRSQSGVSQESVRSLPGVCQEPVRSLSGACQESVRILKETKFGELIWTALQIGAWCHLQKILSVCLLWFCWESIESQSGVCQESDWNQIWRADLNRSPNCALSPVDLH